MLYFSPLSVTDDKQLDRKHPFSSLYSAGRAKHGGGWGGRPTVQARYLGDLVDVCPTVQARQYGETQCRQVGAGNMERYNQFIEACRSSLGVVLGDLVDVAAWGIVPCVSKIDTLGWGGGEGGGFWRVLALGPDSVFSIQI